MKSKTTGDLIDDPIYAALFPGKKSVFKRFENDGVAGLCAIEGSTLFILAILSNTPGQGDFRKFMESAKKEFLTINILEIWNPIMREILKKYGFTVSANCGPKDHYWPVSGMKWMQETPVSDEVMVDKTRLEDITMRC